MPRRKLIQNNQASDDETESEGQARPVKQLKKQNSIVPSNMPSTSKEYDYNTESVCNYSTETSGSSEIGGTFDSFSSLLNAFSFKVENDDDDDDDDDDDYKKLDSSQSTSSECVNTRSDFEREELKKRVTCPILSSHENNLDTNIRIISIPTKLSELVIFDHPASITLHGYVEVSVWLGRVNIFGYKLKEGKSIEVLSTEGTGLMKAVTLKSPQKSTLKALKNHLEELTHFQRNIDLEELVDSIGCKTVVLKVQKIVGASPIRFLQLHYPNALQTRWSKSETVRNENKFELCSTKESYTIGISEDFEILSEELSEIMSQSVSDGENFGPRIIILGEQKLEKTTLIRYLINSTLNKHPVFYFLDTDLGQTEYTPPGIVSLYRVTKPLLGPSFTHQKKALKMIYVGSFHPGASPKLFQTSVKCLMKYFNYNFPKETLFVNTMGWCKDLDKLCLQYIRDIVKPTVVIHLVPSGPDLSLEKEVNEDKVTFFYIPSKAPSESGKASYSSKELREFNLTSYFGQLLAPHSPASVITSFPPVSISWDKVALYVMWKKTPPERLIESVHGGIVALCHVDLSYVLESDNFEFPLTLSDEPICECLGFGIVRASDETKRLFYVVTPLQKDVLEKVNALVKGDVTIPDSLIYKQTVFEKSLPFTDFPNRPKGLGLKPKRAFRNARTRSKRL